MNTTTSLTAIPIKLIHNGDIRRFQLSLDSDSDPYERLAQYIAAVFPKVNTPRLRFYDDDQDLCTITSSQELQEAVTITVEQKRANLKIYLSTPQEVKENATPQEVKDTKQEAKQEAKRQPSDNEIKQSTSSSSSDEPVLTNGEFLALLTNFLANPTTAAEVPNLLQMMGESLPSISDDASANNLLQRLVSHSTAIRDHELTQTLLTQFRPTLVAGLLRASSSPMFAFLPQVLPMLPQALAMAPMAIGGIRQQLQHQGLLDQPFTGFQPLMSGLGPHMFASALPILSQLGGGGGGAFGGEFGGPGGLGGLGGFGGFPQAQAQEPGQGQGHGQAFNPFVPPLGQAFGQPQGLNQRANMQSLLANMMGPMMMMGGSGGFNGFNEYNGSNGGGGFNPLSAMSGQHQQQQQQQQQDPEVNNVNAPNVSNGQADHGGPSHREAVEAVEPCVEVQTAEERAQYSQQLQELENMGFPDTDYNLELLKIMEGDTQQVINVLLERFIG